MTCISYFTPDLNDCDLPELFPSPFSHDPHPLAKQACKLLQSHLLSQTDWQHDFDADDGGKMFGVLVVCDKNDRIGFLAGFSGTLAGRWILPGFVPPVFDQSECESFLPAGELALTDYAKQISALQNDGLRLALHTELQQLTQERDAALTTLKEAHNTRKLQRHEKRARLSLATDDNRALYLRLAYESQQDKREQKKLMEKWRATLAPVQEKLDEIDSEIEVLKKTLTRLSNTLHKKMFAMYILSNKFGEQQQLTDFFAENMLPGGAGDCAGPKLIHYAQQHDLTPLAMAEFWWGAAPKEDVRHHGHYYPACRGKCRPILPFMLKGHEVQQPPQFAECFEVELPETVYEDDELLVVNKPSGMLSVSGKEVQDSVLVRLQQRYPDATGPLLVHRLDLATSGLLLVAKNLATHKALQKQFLLRNIEKRYVAVLDRLLPESQNSGIIELPLRVDLHDRPRQLVCYNHGKAAVTQWQVIAREGDTTRVYFYPQTGRTHQLRLHAAHKAGLNAPIKGDTLYGYNDDGRLWLHAERLCFTHPNTGKRIIVEAPVPF